MTRYPWWTPQQRLRFWIVNHLMELGVFGLALMAVAALVYGPRLDHALARRQAERCRAQLVQARTAADSSAVLFAPRYERTSQDYGYSWTCAEALTDGGAR